MEEGNYARCRGKNNGGTKKAHYHKLLSHLIKQAGCRQERTPEMVKSKIQGIEKKFYKTQDFIQNTGQGILKDYGKESLKDVVIKQFKYYYDLERIFSDRAKA
jgi:hypothetical protein